MLREDPGYFVETVKEIKEHDVDTLGDTRPAAWKTATVRVIADAFVYFLAWAFFDRKLSLISSMDFLSRRTDSTQSQATREDESFWGSMFSIVNPLVRFAIVSILDGLPPSPRLRHCFYWNEPDNDPDTWSNAKASITASELRVCSIFKATREHGNIFGLHFVVQEIQYMFDTDPKASKLVDSYIVSHFSDLDMLTELKTRIAGLRIWSDESDVPDKIPPHEIDQEANSEIFDPICKLRAGLEDACWEAKLLDNPLSGVFDYPADKSYTEANIRQMRVAELALDSLWFGLELYLQHTSNLSPFRLMHHAMMGPRELQRTPEWIPFTAQRSLMPASTTTLPTMTSSRVIQSRSKSENEIRRLAPKVKTKGAASLPATEHGGGPHDGPPGQDNLSVPQRISVDRRTFNVVSALLPEIGNDNHQRVQITWQEMLQGLNSIGLQPEKLYGSVWLFKPKKKNECLVEMKRSIQFHEPHSGGKIPPNMVRVFGKRLTHAYGWEGGMFVAE